MLTAALEGDFDAFGDVYGEDVVYNDLSGDVQGRGALAEYLGAWWAAFPDIDFAVQEILANDDTVVTRFRTRATMENEFMGIDPTGKAFDLVGMALHRIEDGGVVEERRVWDSLALFSQIGVDPATL